MLTPVEFVVMVVIELLPCEMQAIKCSSFKKRLNKTMFSDPLHSQILIIQVLHSNKKL